MKKLAILVLMTLPAAAFAQSAPKSKKAGSHGTQPARQMKVIDGDTIYVQPASRAPKARKKSS